MFALRPDKRAAVQTIADEVPAIEYVWSPTEPLLAVSIAEDDATVSRIELLRFDDEGVASAKLLPAPQPPGRFAHIDFSPDGRYLTYQATDVKGWSGLQVLDVNHADAWLALSNVYTANFEWSPGGASLAFAIKATAEQLYIARAPALVPKLVILPDGAHSPQFPWLSEQAGSRVSPWSWDEQLFAFQARQGDQPGQRMFVTGASCDVPAVLISPGLNALGGVATGPAWSLENGRFLTYQDVAPSTGSPSSLARYVVSVTGAGSSAPAAFSGAKDPFRWLSSHEALVLRNEDGSHDVLVQDLEAFPDIASHAVMHADGPCLVTTPASPTRALLSCSNDTSSMSLAIWDRSWPEAQLDFGAEHIWLSDWGWSPSGEDFAFVARKSKDGGRSLYVAHLAANRVDELGDDAAEWKGSNVFHPRPWSADGSTIAYPLEEHRLAVQSVSDPSQVFVVAEAALEVGLEKWQRAF